MGMYKSVKATFASEYKSRPQIYKDRITRWRADPPIKRIEKPTNIAKARQVGYKAKEGVIVVRVRVKGGKKKKEAVGGGRKPSKSGRFFSISKSTQSIAEDRAARRFPNTEVLNSYFIGSAGSDRFFEIILLDRASSSILSDPNYRGVVEQKGRSYRGLTYSGRKHRGIAVKGYGTIKRRPSKRSNLRS